MQFPFCHCLKFTSSTPTLATVYAGLCAIKCNDIFFWHSYQVGDMAELGISEAFKVKQAVLLSATEAAEMILRVDEIITCAPRRREDRM